MLRKKFIAAVAACAFLILPSASQAAEKAVVFGGGEWLADSYYAYLGGIAALSGDMAQDGWLARVDLGYGGYDYDNILVPGGDVDGDFFNVDLMAGYQHFYSNGVIYAYLGGLYTDHDLSPNDATNPVDGSEFGVKGQIELLHSFTDRVGLDLAGYLTSAYDGYWLRLRPGYDVTGTGVYVGPEVTVLGGENFDQQRAGLFVNGAKLGPLMVGASAGYNWQSRRGDNSAYGTVNFSKTF